MTTVGRIIFNEALPERLRFKNYAMKKENLKQVIGDCFKEYGRVKTTELADEIKRLGFYLCYQGRCDHRHQRC